MTWHTDTGRAAVAPEHVKLASAGGEAVPIAGRRGVASSGRGQVCPPGRDCIEHEEVAEIAWTEYEQSNGRAQHLKQAQHHVMIDLVPLS